MRPIEVLDQKTIDQIAAGEVVERPASIVKELAENAIDAGATAVAIDIRDGGITQIRITDDGCGIAENEIAKAFLRYALAIALSGNLRPGDELLSISGKPYDTLEEVIGIRPSRGSLAEYGVTYRQVNLLPDGNFDLDGIRAAITPKTKLAAIQRSKGYEVRRSLSVDQIREAIACVKSVRPDIICMRKEIEQNGGTYLFRHQVTDLVTEGNELKGLVVNGTETLDADLAVLAPGHSARDTMRMLQRHSLKMEPKAFAVGLRIEHPQRMIDLSQYGCDRGRILPPAAYKLTHQTESGRGVYSFCMSRKAMPS